MLAEIKDGSFAKKWISENENGRPWFKQTRNAEQDQPIEQVGEKLRSLMPFLNPITIRPDAQG